MRCSILAGWLAVVATAMAGDLSWRQQLTFERVLKGGPPHYSNMFVLADTVPLPLRRFTEYSGDVSGRFLEAMACADRTLSLHHPEMDRLVLQLVENQKEDGHFGGEFNTNRITTSEMAILWGNGRLLVGLLEYHKLKPELRALNAARRLGDFLRSLEAQLNSAATEQEFSKDQFASGYICWTSCIEGLVELSRATRDTRYRELADRMTPRVSRHPGQHSHGFLTSLRGILELYRETREARYLEQVEREWAGLQASHNVLPHGAIPEAFHPNVLRDEGCAEADWVRLNLSLYQETGHLAYLDQAELALFNELALNQFKNGDFGHRKFSPDGITHESARAWWCCSLHGLRALCAVPAAAFRPEGSGLAYLLPVDGTFSVTGLTVTASSALELDGSVELRIRESDKQSRTLALRCPPWASRLEAKGFERVGDPGAEPFYRSTRVWKKGETIRVRYLFRTRVMPAADQPGLVMVAHGPWFLGVNSEQSPRFFDEPHSLNRVVIAAPGSSQDISLSRVKRVGLAAEIPYPQFQLTYYPGGYPLQPQTAVLAPLASQTLLPDATAWVFRFKLDQ